MESCWTDFRALSRVLNGIRSRDQRPGIGRKRMVVTVIIRLRQGDNVPASENVLNQNLIGVGLVALDLLYLQWRKKADRDGKRLRPRSQAEAIEHVVKSNLSPYQSLARCRISNI